MINQLISIISVVLNQVIKPNSVAGDNIETVENYTPVYIRCPSLSLQQFSSDIAHKYTYICPLYHNQSEVQYKWLFQLNDNPANNDNNNRGTKGAPTSDQWGSTG